MNMQLHLQGNAVYYLVLVVDRVCLLACSLSTALWQHVCVFFSVAPLAFGFCKNTPSLA